MVANGDAPKKDSLSCHWSCHSLSQGGGQTRFCSTANTFISSRHYITNALHYTTLHHIILHCAALRDMSAKNWNTYRLCYVQPFYPLRHYHLTHSIKVMHRTLFTNILNHIWQDNTKHIPPPLNAVPPKQVGVGKGSLGLDGHLLQHQGLGAHHDACLLVLTKFSALGRLCT